MLELELVLIEALKKRLEEEGSRLDRTARTVDNKLIAMITTKEGETRTEVLASYTVAN